MISAKLAWFILLVQLTILKGYTCLNMIEGVTNEETHPQPTLPVETQSVTEVMFPSTGKEIPEITTPTENRSTIASETHLEIIEIFHGDNLTTTPLPEQIIVNATTNCLNISSYISSVNLTCVDRSWNDIIKTNYTTVAEAVGAAEGFPEGLQNTAAIAAGIFLVSAVIGYFSCVGYRRFLQRKYGNSEILSGEEVYDTTDLRYFEI